MEGSNDMTKFVGGLLLGAMIGGAVGVLFAPDKGTRTRRRIMSQGEDITDAIEDKFDDFLGEVKKEMEMVQEKAHELVAKGKNEVSKLS